VCSSQSPIPLLTALVERTTTYTHMWLRTKCPMCPAVGREEPPPSTPPTSTARTLLACVSTETSTSDALEAPPCKACNRLVKAIPTSRTDTPHDQGGCVPHTPATPQVQHQPGPLTAMRPVSRVPGPSSHNAAHSVHLHNKAPQQQRLARRRGPGVGGVPWAQFPKTIPPTAPTLHLRANPGPSHSVLQGLSRHVPSPPTSVSGCARTFDHRPSHQPQTDGGAQAAVMLVCHRRPRRYDTPGCVHEASASTQCSVPAGVGNLTRGVPAGMCALPSALHHQAPSCGMAVCNPRLSAGLASGPACSRADPRQRGATGTTQPAQREDCLNRAHASLQRMAGAHDDLPVTSLLSG
jgi:hypothetical protein